LTQIDALTIDVPVSYTFQDYNIQLNGSMDTLLRLTELREKFAEAPTGTAIHAIPGRRPKGEDMTDDNRLTAYIQFTHGDRPIDGWYLLRGFSMYQNETPLGVAYNWAINLFYLGTDAYYTACYLVTDLDVLESDWSI